MRLIFSLLFVLTFTISSFGQKINLPELQEVEIFQYLRNSISIQLFYNENSQLTFKVGNEISTEVDSLKSMLLKPLNAFSNGMLDDGFVKTELLIDEAIRMSDVEILFHELRRLGLNKILYAAKWKKYFKIDRITKLGIMHYVPSFTREEVKEFYKKRNLPPKKYESIGATIIKKRKIEAERLNPSPPQIGPPPEPKVEMMTPTEKSLERNYPEAKVIYIEISKKKKINFNGKKVKLDDLNDLVLEELLKGKCIFILKVKRESSYEKFLVGMSSVVMMREKALNIYAKERMNQSFESLDWRKKNEIKKEIPRLFLSKMVD